MTSAKNPEGAGRVVGFIGPRRPDDQPADTGSTPRSDEAAARSRRRVGRAALVGLVVVVATVGAGLLWRTLHVPPAGGLLEASGRIEGRITTVSPKSLGVVTKVLVDEGQRVTRGQVLAVLDDAAQRQRIRGAEENLRAVAAKLESANTQLTVSTEQVPLQIAQAQDQLTQARGTLEGARASALQARRDADRDARLLTQSLIAAQQAETSSLKARVTSEMLNEAEANVARAEKGLALAHLGLQQLEAQRKDRESVARQVEQARAALAEQQSYVADFTIRSPLNGTVLTRNIELGERVSVGDTLYTLVDLNQLYLKVFVPEPEIGRVALGQEARVSVDAFPGRAFPARVNRVYQAAEFTPKNVETKEERVKLVFPVELVLLENPGGVLKPGMPADGLIRVDRDAPWVAPKATPARPLR